MVIKLLEGTQGVGVILAETLKVAEAIIETLQSNATERTGPEVHRRERGRDIRAFVVGDQVVAAMRRVAKVKSFAARASGRQDRNRLAG